MTSSLRNSVHRRNHKERSQLAHRKKLGILEKHKDYVKRARDYHSKQDRIIRLRQKAAERNKDEFYFAMNKEKTRRGVHVKDRGNVALPTDIVKVLKTQDENYIRTARAAGRKKIDKIKSQLTALADLVRPTATHEDGDSDVEEHLEQEELDTLQEAGILPTRSKGGKHIIFVDGDEDARRYAKGQTSPLPKSRGISEVEANTSIDLGWKTAPPKATKRRQSQSTEDEANLVVGPDSDEISELTPSTRKKLLKELGARLKRDKMLGYTQREFEMQRLLMGKGARRKILDAEKVEGSDSEDDVRPSRKPKHVDEATYKPRVYKWRRERKR